MNELLTAMLRDAESQGQRVCTECEAVVGALWDDDGIDCCEQCGVPLVLMESLWRSATKPVLVA